MQSFSLLNSKLTKYNSDDDSEYFRHWNLHESISEQDKSPKIAILHTNDSILNTESNASKELKRIVDYNYTSFSNTKFERTSSETSTITSRNIRSRVPLDIEELELQKLKNLVNLNNMYSFRENDSHRFWNKLRKRLKQDTCWVFYMNIGKVMYPIFISTSPNFDKIYENIRVQFPILYAKYSLNVKQIDSKPIKVF